MDSRFSDPHVRDAYINEIVLILSEIFSITESDKKEAIYAELHDMDDASLLRKKDLIENYFQSLEALKKKHIFQITKIGNEFIEKEERASTNLIINF